MNNLFAAALDEVQRLQSANWPDEVPTVITYPAGVPAIVEHLRYWAVERPNTVAISFYGTDITYADYDEMSDRFAGWLVDNGVTPGQRVGVHLQNCPQFHVAMLGILKVGAVHVPINPLFKGHELRHELADAEVGVVLTQTDLRHLVESIRSDTPVHTVVATSLGDLLSHPPSVTTPFDADDRAGSDWPQIMGATRFERQPSDPDAMAALNYTGGTTGMPKGCEHSQRHMAYTAATVTMAGGRTPGSADAVNLNFLPIFWIAGEDFGILKPLINGETVVLMTRWDADAAAALIAAHRVTDTVATVDNYVELMNLPHFDGEDFRSLRSPAAVSFVLKLTPELRQQWFDATGSVLREASYGMTETHTADTFTLGFQDGDRDLLGSPVFCGLPVPGTDILIVDEQGDPVPIGTSGEIIVRSPSILTAYHRRPEATSDSIRDGWLHTGDVGCFDEWGALHYLARTKEMIKINGMSVFPSEVEALLAQNDDVDSVTVVPRPDHARGQVPVAFVVPTTASVSEVALHEWALENMARYKVPEIVLVDEMPMTATGKVRKGVLLERAAELTAEMEFDR